MYTDVILTKKPATFVLIFPEKWMAFPCVIHWYADSHTWRGCIFLILRHFVAKLGNFTNLEMPFLGMVKDLVPFAGIKV